MIPLYETSGIGNPKRQKVDERCQQQGARGSVE